MESQLALGLKSKRRTDLRRKAGFFDFDHTAASRGVRETPYDPMKYRFFLLTLFINVRYKTPVPQLVLLYDAVCALFQRGMGRKVAA